MTQTNFAKSTVAMGYDALATSIDLVPGGGTQFPTPPFNATWWNITDYPDPADDPNAEVIKVININGDTLDIVRAQEGTSASVKNIPGKTYALMIDLVPETGVEHTDIMGHLVPYVGATQDVNLGYNNLIVNGNVGIGVLTQPIAPLTLYYDNYDVLNPVMLIRGSNQMTIGFVDDNSNQMMASIRVDNGGSIVLNTGNVVYIGYADLGSYASEIDLYTVGGLLVLDGNGNLSLFANLDFGQSITLNGSNRTITTWGDLTLTGGNFTVGGTNPSTITGGGTLSVIGGPLQTQNLRVMALPVYANNAAAVAGGLTPGDFYRTGTDPDYVCVVH